MVSLYLLREIFACFCCNVVVYLPEFLCQGEETSREEPFGEHVAGGIADQNPVRYMLDYLLQLLEIRSPAVFNPFLVLEHEVSEAEF